MMPFIVLEGCDGAGKTTIREIIKSELESRKIAVVTIGQHSWLHPWNSRLIIQAREQRSQVPPEVLTSAYLSDKYLHGKHNVMKAISTAVVIADRWIYSDAVYHSVLYGTSMRETLEAHFNAGTLIPDLVAYVTIDPEEAYRRILQRGKHTRHYERPADLRRIVNAYEELWNSNLTFLHENQIVRLDNSEKKSGLKEKVCSLLNDILRLQNQEN